MRRGRRGNTILELAMFLPVLLLLLVGMVQLGKITYVYYTLKKSLYAGATFLASQQGVNFCDDADPLIAAAREFALTGTTDGSSPAIIPDLTADQIQVQTECVDPTTQAPGTCALVCDLAAAAGSQKPDYIIFSILGGYQVAPRFPFMLVDPIPLRPQIRIPYGGT
jgi:hypothetical protein